MISLVEILSSSGGEHCECVWNLQPRPQWCLWRSPAKDRPARRQTAAPAPCEAALAVRPWSSSSQQLWICSHLQVFICLLLGSPSSSSWSFMGTHASLFRSGSLRKNRDLYGPPLILQTHRKPHHLDFGHISTSFRKPKRFLNFFGIPDWCKKC